MVAGVACLLAARLAKWPPAEPAGGRSPSGSQATPSGMSAALSTWPVNRCKVLVGGELLAKNKNKAETID